ncbi:glycosyl transferase 8 family protein [Helicobacter pylori SouthAfrica50]|uniref:Glycosyl transferase 8 family protein n=1 Tax=Helicobacter pylori SouthAfrica50 TaxID=1352357 RepID=T2SCC5_HELPX|nr:glycosyl transferase 8 family protein [Helicobacter pylori SouthAfrica50]
MNVQTSPNQVIPIFISFDKNYALGAGVSLYSLLSHASKHTSAIDFSPINQNNKLSPANIVYKIHCLIKGVTLEQQNKLLKTIEPFKEFASLEFIDINSLDHSIESYLNESCSKRYGGLLILCRLLLASLFPNYSKIISIDVDTVFLGDIASAYFALDNDPTKLLGMVKDTFSHLSFEAFCHFIQRICKNFKIDFSRFSANELQRIHQGFNMGFLVANLDLWRENGFEKIALEFLKTRGKDLFYPEQCLINMVFWKRILELPIHYNCYSDFFNQHYPKNIVMLHFIKYKPWHSISSLNDRLICYEATASFWLANLFCTPFKNDFFKERLEMAKDQQMQSFKTHIRSQTIRDYFCYRIKNILKKVFKFS